MIEGAKIREKYASDSLAIIKWKMDSELSGSSGRADQVRLGARVPRRVHPSDKRMSEELSDRLIHSAPKLVY